MQAWLQANKIFKISSKGVCDLGWNPGSTTYKLFDLGQITQPLSTSVFLSQNGIIYLIELIRGLKEFISIKCFKNSAWDVASAKVIYYIIIPVLSEKALKL